MSQAHMTYHIAQMTFLQWNIYYFKKCSNLDLNFAIISQKETEAHLCLVNLQIQTVDGDGQVWVRLASSQSQSFQIKSTSVQSAYIKDNI